MWFRRESIAKQALVHLQCDAKLIKKLHLLRIDIGNLGSFVSGFNEKNRLQNVEFLCIYPVLFANLPLECRELYSVIY